MGKIANIEPLVTWLLENFPETRDSDSLLYSRACEKTNPAVKMMPFNYVLENRARFGLPNMESIRRARQKVQAKNAELRATPETRAARYSMEKEYKAYALE